MKQREKSKFQDDDRTIADMNVEGMRWHASGKPTGEDRNGPDKE